VDGGKVQDLMREGKAAAAREERMAAGDPASGVSGRAASDRCRDEEDEYSEHNAIESGEIRSAAP